MTLDHVLYKFFLPRNFAHQQMGPNIYNVRSKTLRLEGGGKATRLDESFEIVGPLTFSR